MLSGVDEWLVDHSSRAGTSWKNECDWSLKMDWNQLKVMLTTEKRLEKTDRSIEWSKYQTQFSGVVIQVNRPDHSQLRAQDHCKH